jgi:hypothetical protein
MSNVRRNGWRVMGAVIMASAISACITTQEMPLAPNVVRLDTQASGLLYTGKVASATMRRAVELTIAKGYTHFRFEEAAMGQGSAYGGSISSGSATWSRGSLSAMSFSSPVYIPTAGVAVTVIMLKPDDVRATDAFVAADVLREASTKG